MTTTENSSPSSPWVQHDASNWLKMWLTTSYVMAPGDLRERVVEHNSEIVLMYCTEEGDTLEALTLEDCQLLCSLDILDPTVLLTKSEIVRYEGEGEEE